MVMMICLKTNECDDIDCLHYGEHTDRSDCKASSLGGESRHPTGCPMCVKVEFFSEDEFKI